MPDRLIAFVWPGQGARVQEMLDDALSKLQMTSQKKASLEDKVSRLGSRLPQ